MDTTLALASNCREATVNDPVLNSECAFTFHTPFTSPKGIVVNLKTYVGTIEELAFNNVTSESDKEGVFVRIVKERVAKDNDGKTNNDSGAAAGAGEGTAEEKQPTKLGIGVDGGFAGEDDKWETKTTYSVVVLTKKGDADVPPTVVTELPYNEDTKPTFSESIVKLVDSVILHAGMTTQQEVKAWQLDSDEPIIVSKYAADLPFVDNGVMIDPNPASWKCEKTGATENLWLNLSDGFIGGGRKNWDGSGGSNGALDHFQETGETFPLTVKLGTITADLNSADCYSYAKDEDCPVKVPNLAELLEKRGIKVAQMYVTRLD